MHRAVVRSTTPRFTLFAAEDSFGGELHAERRFGDFVLPSHASVGWWFGTPRYKPFFKALIEGVRPTYRWP